MLIYLPLFILGAIVMWLFMAYNRLIMLQQRVKNAWSQIDVQLKRRHDLIPNLVEVVKGYMAYERQTLENVIIARTQAAGASAIKEKQVAENFLTSALRSLFALVENYPDLKANQNMLKLQEELATTENRISFARQYYNDEVMFYNTAIQSIPVNLIANMGSFKKVDFFEIEDPIHRELPQVKI